MSTCDYLFLRYLQTLLATKSLDLDEACRQMASVCLGPLPITANDVIPLINNAFSSSTTNRHKHARKNESKMKDMGADFGDALYSDIQRYIWLVEFLQWRLDDILGSVSLVKPVQATLTHLFSGCRSDASSTNDGSGNERAQQLYALQLTVGILQSLAKLLADAGADRDMQAFDIDLAISCAQFAPDAAVRSEALRLISVLASTMPQAVLDHALRVVTVLENASAFGDFIDAHSINLACQTLTAVGKAWIDGGRDVQSLVRTVVGATIKAHAIQQLPLLRALETALRESNVPSTSHVIFSLLSHAMLSLTAAGQEVAYKEDDTLLISLAKKILQKVRT